MFVFVKRDSHMSHANEGAAGSVRGIVFIGLHNLEASAGLIVMVELF